MDRRELVDAVREENRTELSRLGSSKSLYADTEGEMESEAVLAAAVDNAAHAAEALVGWDGADAFESAAGREESHSEDIAGKLDDHDPGDPPAAAAALAGRETTVERLGALVGWTLVTEEKASQCSGFFTGQADPQTATLFRGFGDDYEASREEALDALETVCEGEEDWEAAAAAATSVVEAAYDEYVERLESMGVNPKPVC